jgi:hypothetical protein
MSVLFVWPSIALPPVRFNLRPGGHRTECEKEKNGQHNLHQHESNPPENGHRTKWLLY